MFNPLQSTPQLEESLTTTVRPDSIVVTRCKSCSFQHVGTVEVGHAEFLRHLETADHENRGHYLEIEDDE